MMMKSSSFGSGDDLLRFVPVFYACSSQDLLPPASLLASAAKDGYVGISTKSVLVRNLRILYVAVYLLKRCPLIRFLLFIKGFI